MEMGYPGVSVALVGIVVASCTDDISAQSTSANINQVPGPDVHVVFETNRVNYNFPSPGNADYDAAMVTNYYNSGYVDAVITGVKLWGLQTFVTVPRWRSGVPSTLNVIDNGNLSAWPSWSMQKIGDCSALQYVQSMEINSYTNEMWIIDVGRVNILEAIPDNSCPPKIVIVDIPSASVVSSTTLPDSTASYTESFLNDIVLDPNKNMAYISDTGTGALIVFSRDTGESRRFSDTSTLAVPGFVFMSSGVEFVLPTPEDGIALDPTFETLFYSPLSGLHVYSVSTAALSNLNASLEMWNASIYASQIDHGQKVAPSDGMAFDQDGVLYFGGLNSTSVYSWTPGQGTIGQAQQVVFSDPDLQWVDTFAFAPGGDLVFTSNKLSRYANKSLDFSPGAPANFRVLRAYNGAVSYMGEPSGPLLNSKPDASPYVGYVVGAAAILGLLCLVALYLKNSRTKERSSVTEPYGMLTTTESTAGAVGWYDEDGSY